MVLLEGWSYGKGGGGGLTGGADLHERQSYKTVLLDGWSCKIGGLNKRSGLTRGVVLQEGWSSVRGSTALSHLLKGPAPGRMSSH